MSQIENHLNRGKKRKKTPAILIILIFGVVMNNNQLDTTDICDPLFAKVKEK